MYLLINPDNTVNYGDDHPIREDLHLEGLRLIEFEEKTLYEVVGEIHAADAYWDDATQTVVEHPRIEQSKMLKEKKWRDEELNSVISKLDQYDRDLRIPEEYRTSSISEEDYLKLLKYRKRLCEYPDTEEFKSRVRPNL